MRMLAIKSPGGKEVHLFPEQVNAMNLETRFHLVRIHLEGSDHTVHFPDKETGDFKNLVNPKTVSDLFPPNF